MQGRKCFRPLLILLLAQSAAIFGQEPSVVRGVPGPAPAAAQSHWAQISPGILPIPSRLPITQPGPVRFRTIVRAAGMIFSGTVTNIERPPAHGEHEIDSKIDTVAITFHVENVIRGATTGSTLTIRQWMGAWSSGQRYRVGERLLLFLYPTSRLGLTSWVGGRMGRFEIDAFGRVTLTEEHRSAFRNDPLFSPVFSGKQQLAIRDFARAIQLAESEP